MFILMALLLPEAVRPRKKLCHIHIKHRDFKTAIRISLAQIFVDITFIFRRFLHFFGTLAGELAFCIRIKIANAFGIDGTYQNMMSYTYQLSWR